MSSRERSVTLAVVRSRLVPGWGHLHLGLRDPGRRFLALYLAVAGPTLVALLVWGPWSLAVGAIPGFAIWFQAQRDLQRRLGLSRRDAPEDPHARIPDDIGAWLDVLVLLVIAGFWLALTVMVAVGGGTVIEVALVFFLGAAAAFQWAYTSYAWDKLRGGRRP